MTWWLLLLPFMSLLKTKATADDDADDDDADDDDEEEIRKPKALIASLRDANHRLSRKLKKKDKRIKELEAQISNGDDQDQNDDEDEDDDSDPRLIRLENLFLRHSMTLDVPIQDLETAFDLFIRKDFADAVKDDGEGIEGAVSSLLDRYPYLVDVADDDDEPAPRSARDTGRTPRPLAPRVAQAAGRQALAQRFPALRGKVKRRS